jgi:hypothetical protein
MASETGWCYGPVLCEKTSNGIEMTCVDWQAPGTPCPWTHTASNSTTAALRGMAHAAKHRS